MTAKIGQLDLEKVLEVIIAFNSKKNYIELLDIILTKMMEITEADAGTLYIIENNQLHFRIVRNITLGIFQPAKGKIDLPPIKLDKENIRNVSAYAAIKNQIVTIDDVYNNGEFNFEGPKNYDKITGYRTRAMLVLPLCASTDGDDEVIGVIQLLNARDRETGEFIPFGDLAESPILPALSKIAANTLSNALFAQEIKDLFSSFVNVMTQAIDERSPYNSNHTRNVVDYCGSFANYLSGVFPKGHEYHFNETRREQLIMSAYLHDIGKIITPLDIMDKPDRLGSDLGGVQYRLEIKKYQCEVAFLRGEISQEAYQESLSEIQGAAQLIESVNSASFLSENQLEEVQKLENLTFTNEFGKIVPLFTEQNITALKIQKGTLTEDERKIMQAHVSMTERLLEKMNFDKYYKGVSNWARSHHEFLDGTGYPHGISGDQVSTETRILTLMDIFDALTASDRPYKKPIPAKQALVVLQGMAKDGKLNGELVELFIASGQWKRKEEEQEKRGVIN